MTKKSPCYGGAGEAVPFQNKHRVFRSGASALPCDFLRRGVPHCRTLVEVRVVRQVTAERRVISEDFVFHARLATAHVVKEVGLVINGIVVALRGHVLLNLVGQFRGKRSRRWMILLPVVLVLLAQIFGPALGGIALHLRRGILRRECE